MVLISLYGEKQYLIHCEELGLKCERGQMHDAKDSFYKWIDSLVTKIKKTSYLK